MTTPEPDEETVPKMMLRQLSVTKETSTDEGWVSGADGRQVQQQPLVAEDDTWTDTFQKFCRSSTIHGTYFLAETSNRYAKFMWGLVVVISIAIAGMIIQYSYDSWETSPDITSVRQIPIEKVQFPAVTICPIDDTRRVNISQITMW